MGKDPAFLLYSNDFVAGVSDLTMEERGQYITLLCLQHQKGHLSEKAVKVALGIESLEEISDLLSKFSVDKNGCFFNKRMDAEIKKRAATSKARTESAYKSWENRPCKSKANAYANAEQKHKQNDCKSPASRVENEDEIPVSPVRVKESDCIEERYFSPLLKAAVENWLLYKRERRDSYKPTGFTQFLNKVERKAKECGEMAVIEGIETAMANGWMGVAWDKIRGSPQKDRFANLDNMEF